VRIFVAGALDATDAADAISRVFQGAQQRGARDAADAPPGPAEGAGPAEVRRGLGVWTWPGPAPAHSYAAGWCGVEVLRHAVFSRFSLQVRPATRGGERAQ
jgi:hypothetical protein